MKFRAKPIVVEAVQFKDTADCIAEISDFVGEQVRVFYHFTIVVLTIEIPEGEMVVSIDDWIIKGAQGELSQCKPGVFEQIYEEIVDAGVAQG